MPVKDIPARISAILPQTPDSVEIAVAFEGPVPFDYQPGQFVMLEVVNPRFDAHWKPMGPSDIWQYIADRGAAQLGELHTAFPMLDERTILSFLKKLEQVGAVSMLEEAITNTAETDPQLPPPAMKRAYSLGSTPTREGSINTMVKVTPGGYMSTYLVNKLAVGDEVLISGPLGHFMLPPEETPGDILLIGAGSGITPLMGMLRWAQDTKTKRHFHLVYSNKTPEDIIYFQELEELAQNAHIEVTHTITRPETATTAWNGRTGRVDKSLLEELVQEAPQRHAYICGSMAFAKSMKELLIELGATPDNIKLEAYG